MTWLPSPWLPSMLTALPAGQGKWELPGVRQGTSLIETGDLLQKPAGRESRGDGRLRGPALAWTPIP